MKKIIALLTVVIIVFSAMSFSVSAAVPTELTITETKTAPNIKDGGVIDKAYGNKVFDIKGSDHSLDSQNLYPNKTREPHLLEEKLVKDAIAAMRNIGYMTYDKDNLYIACEVTDIAPKAASNNSEYWKSTNLQLVIFLNQELNFPTIAYEGKNKVKVWGDERSVLDYELVEATFTEKSQTKYIYEIKIPWNAFPEVSSVDDVEEIKMGIVQSSMANGYVCSAFGEAYHLKYDKCIPVTLAKAGNTSSNDKKPTTSKQETTSSKQETTSSKDTVSKDNANNNTVSQNNPSSTPSTDNTDKNTASNKVDSSVNAPTTGTDIVTDGAETTSSQAPTESAGEGTTTVITEEGEKDWTPIIIIGIVAVVIIAGGVVAIILMNKKPSA